MRSAGGGVGTGLHTALSSAVSVDWRTGGISKGWSLAERTCFVSVLVIFLLVLEVVLQAFAQSRLDLVPFLDPQVLSGHIRLSIVALATWISLLGVSIKMRRIHPEARWLAHFPIQLFAIGSAFNAYMLGILTNPFGVLSLAGGLPVSLLVYGARPTWLGVGSFAGLLCAAIIASQHG